MQKSNIKIILINGPLVRPTTMLVKMQRELLKTEDLTLACTINMKDTIQSRDCDQMSFSLFTLKQSSFTHQLWFIAPVNSWKNLADSNRPQVSMVYRLIDHLVCW